MAKAAKPKKSKYDISVKTDLNFDQLMQLALNTPPKKKLKKK